MADPDQRNRSGYEEVDVLEDPDGIIGVVSKRLSGRPLFTIGIFKRFVRDGVVARSTFFNIDQCDGAVRMIARCKDAAIKRRDESNKQAVVEYENREAKRGGS